VTEEKKQKFSIDAHDVVAIAGLAILIAGIFLVYRPAALIVFGAITVYYAWVTAPSSRG
jgi:hypothetical protein